MCFVMDGDVGGGTLVREILPTDIIISRELFEKVKAALKKNHKHHKDHDDYGGYKGSEMESVNLKALAAIKESEGK
jgi:hypothetical protein